MPLYWVDNPKQLKIAIAPRPRGGDWLDDDIRALKEDGIDVVVSLLEAEEARDLGLTDEELSCHRVGMDFISFPIPDYGSPESIIRASELAQRLCRSVANGQRVIVHCRQGIGRSSVIVACVLVTAGMNAESALNAISSARGLRVPETAEQRDWVLRFARTTTQLSEVGQS